MPTDTLLLDQPTRVQPGQLSQQGIVAAVYLSCYHNCNEQLDKLPELHAQGTISLATYADTDAQLCAMADVFADCLALLGFPQPARCR